MLGVTQCGVGEQGVDRGQAGVAGADAVVALVLQVVEESGHQRGVEVTDVHVGWLGGGALRGEAEQQPEGVAVGGDGVAAGLTLAHQPVGEKRLQGWRQRGHR